MAVSRQQVVQTWTRLLLGGGLGLFWAACIWSPSLPIEAFLVGPAIMVAAAVLIARQQR